MTPEEITTLLARLKKPKEIHDDLLCSIKSLQAEWLSQRGGDGVGHFSFSATLLDLVRELDREAETSKTFSTVCAHCGAGPGQYGFAPMDEDGCCTTCGAACLLESIREEARETDDLRAKLATAEKEIERLKQQNRDDDEADTAMRETLVDERECAEKQRDAALAENASQAARIAVLGDRIVRLEYLVREGASTHGDLCEVGRCDFVERCYAALAPQPSAGDGNTNKENP